MMTDMMRSHVPLSILTCLDELCNDDTCTVEGAVHLGILIGAWSFGREDTEYVKTVKEYIKDRLRESNAAV